MPLWSLFFAAPRSPLEPVREPSLPPPVGLEICNSTVHGAGRGVFAGDDIERGTLIRRSPYVEHNEEVDGRFDGPIAFYAFGDAGDDNRKLIVLDVTSLINHDRNRSNVVYSETPGEQSFDFVAQRDIRGGEELFIDYGKDFWRK